MKEAIQRRNVLQQYLRTETRLWDPVIFLDEAHHGLLVPKADGYPTSISLGCSWDASLMTRIYTVEACEAAARGTNMVLAPVVDVCRNPHCQRTSETSGGGAVVRGFQGGSYRKILTRHLDENQKHFAGHREPESCFNQSPANYSERVLKEFHKEPFRLYIQPFL